MEPRFLKRRVYCKKVNNITIESHSHFQCRIYTSSLAGMLHRVGLLPAGNFQQVPFAYKTYKGGKDSESEAFKNALSREVTIDFIGVWYVSVLLRSILFFKIYFGPGTPSHLLASFPNFYQSARLVP